MPSDDADSDSDSNRDPDSGSDWGRDSGWGHDSDSSPPSDPSSPTGASPPSDPSASSGASPPSDPSSPNGSTSFETRLTEGWEYALRHLELAVVPLLSSLLALDNVRAVLDFRGIHMGLTFRFPGALPDLWTFVSVPSQGSGVHVSPTLFAIPVLILVRGVLVAGLIGSAREVIRTGEYDFAANAREYFVPVVLFVALVHVAGLVTVSAGILTFPSTLLLLLSFPLFILLSYLFYATPYLLVVGDLGVEEGLARSLEWALDGGPYFGYAAGYLLFVAAASLVGTALVVNLGALGILVGAIASAPVALALTFATTGFVADLFDAEDGTDAGRSPGSPGSSREW
ncbi:hypothetical protein [Halorussus litoreus]|uniref:hypothetical protein n=1 Tax=Halorussus litoreus TaxID=1710536 RepID=UPI000E27E871|nr:hypothetical protein [Halorussus litoreus]